MLDATPRCSLAKATKIHCKSGEIPSVRDCTLFFEGKGLEIFTKSSLKKSLPRPKNMTKNPCPVCNSCKKVCAPYVKEIHLPPW